MREVHRGMKPRGHLLRLVSRWQNHDALPQGTRSMITFPLVSGMIKYGATDHSLIGFPQCLLFGKPFPQPLSVLIVKGKSSLLSGPNDFPLRFPLRNRRLMFPSGWLDHAFHQAVYPLRGG